ncbi:hypothetical protein B0H14DRAFT_2715262 [Mycena olivaceomarginata]|nr:hypothetical protein B0H14DRAFT_2715262 [Mycena olivaceomarginata]
MAADLIVLAKYFDMLVGEAGGLSRLVAHAFTTPPSILIQNCAFLTIFLASCKILITSCQRECCIASTSPELLGVSDAEGPDDKAIGIVHCSSGEANRTAENPAIQPDNPRYPTRGRVRTIEKSGGRNGTHSKMTKSACSRQRNDVELPNGGAIVIE